MPKLIVILPAYNEEASIRTLLNKILDLGDPGGWELHVVVCDDGSNDRTAEILEDFKTNGRIRVLTHSINRGLGETIRDLIEYAVGVTEENDAIVRMDCDDTHEPKYIVEMIKKMEQGFDIVVASRFQPGGGQEGLEPFRRFISLGANLFMKLFFPIPGVWEYSCGYRCYRSGVLRRALAYYGNSFLQLKGLGFTCTLEKLVKLRLLGARFAEVPFVLRYDQKLSKSKMSSRATMIGYFVIALLYYWPGRGWRTLLKRKPPPE